MAASETRVGLSGLAEWDWVLVGTGHRLHHAAALDDVQAFEDEARGGGKTTCGIGGTLRVPGLFTRMGALRCKQCCDRLGVPRGQGSPKNDPTLRPWVEARLAAPTPTESEGR